MNKPTFRRQRIARKIILILAAVPLIQLSACQTITQQTLGGIVNIIPSTLFSIIQGSLIGSIAGTSTTSIIMM